MKTKDKKPTIKLQIIKENLGYTAVGQWKERSLVTCGDNWEELQQMIVEMVNLAFEDLGYTYTIEEIKFEYDLESFFDFYKVINAKALSERIGMNQSLLAQYIKGIKKPSVDQTKRILQGVQQIGRELSEVRFLLV
ncbi:MAG: XRE family transcriptional regulator [Crocinitomicaceae bacterium]